MRRIVICGILLVAVITIIIWVISKYVQPILPADINSDFVVMAAILVLVLSALAGFKDVLELVERFTHKREEQQAASPTAQLLRPSDDWQRDAVVDHDALFGVEEILVSLGDQLANPDANWIISIFGEGGIGKTALAYELVKRYCLKSGFTRIAWVSAKPIYVTPVGQTRKEKDVAYFWNDLIGAIADKLRLDIQVIPSAWKIEFPRKMRDLPKNERCLIVIDNLETIEDASETIEYLEQQRIIKPHKVIITTRKSVQRYSNQVVEHQLTGLSRKDARAFIRHLGKGDHNIISSSDAELDGILEVTEGNPFLIKLVVRLFTVRKQPFTAVVADLKSKKADLGDQVGRYLYAQSIRELQYGVGKEDAAKLLNVFCSKVSGEAFDYNELYRRSRINEKVRFEQVRQFACNLSLVRSLDGNRRFTIHSLLREYICTSS
jgi:hypothetical protein